MNLYAFVGNDGVDGSDVIGLTSGDGTVDIDRSGVRLNPRDQPNWSNMAKEHTSFKAMEAMYNIIIAGITNKKGSVYCKCVGKGPSHTILCEVNASAVITLNQDRKGMGFAFFTSTYGHEQRHVLSFRRFVNELIRDLDAEPLGTNDSTRAEQLSVQYYVKMKEHISSNDHKGDDGATLSSPIAGNPMDPLDYSPKLPSPLGGW
ncbi:MAG: hypothetical protein WCK77_17840 [Verrucomicrobiota bacterium]